ncbi:MAG: hypothetical protein Ta2E_11660 [Mycoplasmoidaceae bacterium]|nr:MAG: hypothetical protein Ta2E_11660 [Mycoplasmoidaceae bacterium]
MKIILIPSSENLIVSLKIKYLLFVINFKISIMLNTSMQVVMKSLIIDRSVLLNQNTLILIHEKIYQTLV